MSHININVSEVIGKMREIKQEYDAIELGYRRLTIKYDELGFTWRDSEYRRIEEYLEQAGTVLDRYSKDSDAYLDYVLKRIQVLLRDYSEDSGLGELGGLGGLDELGELDELGGSSDIEEGNIGEPEMTEIPKLI